ncbi:glucan endo-1,3-beta-glucosidase-like [Ziziphus jujuba]|uniref:glucan endo-1,3-beta-D-glucosidase n=1 Tax=Ziziphus jujuba TaxID=326968 RepID=A0ABM4AGH6_ZIZJJ|nr:glucan endo-1,3-beta-glucosidase-like [Ziziphus jujuba]
MITMYKSRNIGRIRLYEPDYSVLEPPCLSDIQVLVGVRNQDVYQLPKSHIAAEIWVKNNINPYWPRVLFRCIGVGNDLIPGPGAQYILRAMKNLRNALLRHGYLCNHIKVSAAIRASCAFPIHHWLERSLKNDYALFSSENVAVKDGGLSCFNLFDAIDGALHAFMQKAVAPGVEAVVLESGWPSAGNGEFTIAKMARV